MISERWRGEGVSEFGEIVFRQSDVGGGGGMEVRIVGSGLDII